MEYQTFLEVKKGQFGIDDYLTYEEDFFFRAKRISIKEELTFEQACDVLADFLVVKELEQELPF